MIRIVRASDSPVVLFVEIKPRFPMTESVWFQRVCASKMERDLLEAHLRQQVNDTMQEIRATLYRIGWSDKASKTRRKQDSFSSLSDVHEWEKERGKP